MRLILIHGINNEGKTTDEIESSWMDELRFAWKSYGLKSPNSFTILTANYGTELADFSRAATDSVKAGGQVRTVSTQEFSLYQEYADYLGIAPEQIEAAANARGFETKAIKQGVPHEAWIIGIANALESVLPDDGTFIAEKFLRQAAVYIERKGVQTAIKSLVRKQVFQSNQAEPTVVVAHSLGTVVSYELLVQDPAAASNVCLFCTLGSPLAVRIICNYVGKRPDFPKPPITNWFNAHQREDFVTMGRGLSKASLGFDGVEDFAEVENYEDDKHSVFAYLRDRTVAQRIHSALLSD
jgi:hypothetical protein